MKNEISSIIHNETFHVDEETFINKDDLFNRCAQWLLKSQIISNIEQFKKLLNDRESMGSTYLGNFIALPHAKGDCIKKPTIVFCRTKEPFIYQSNNECGEVKYVFMLAIPAHTTNDKYMHILASLATALTKDEFLNKLDYFRTCDDFINCFLEIN